MRDNDEFYVGYMPEASKRTASFIKRLIGCIAGLVCIVAILLAWNQKKFSSATFEYGINSRVEGYYFEKPVPHLAVPLGMNTQGREVFQNVILVGFGKAGGRAVMNRIQQKEGKSLVGAKVELTGSLIYGDGKALLQVIDEDNTNLVFLRSVAAPHQTMDTTGERAITGEVVDPKCYFGVMKPGEGKGHRSCAIRCIAGGIAPILHSTEDEYFLVLNEKGEPANEDIMGVVGDQITVTGKEITWNDWKILTIDSRDLSALAARQRLTEQLLSFQDGVTICSEGAVH